MFGNSFGRLFRVTTCGESYAGVFRKLPGIPEQLYGGLIAIVDGVPAGIKLTAKMIQDELDKRRPGQSRLDTPRKEEDRVYIFSGVMEGDYTTGAPVGLLIPNSNIDDANVEKHRSFSKFIRPGQANYTYFRKYGMYADWAGAGRASGRETAARVAAGAVAKAILDKRGVDVIAYTVESHGIKAGPFTYEQVKANYRKNEINCPDPVKGGKMIEDLLEVKKSGNSCGGVIEIIVKGLPAGVGEPVFDKLDAVIAHGLMSIGAVKGIEFGDGFRLAGLKGSESNDTPYYDSDTNQVRFRTNRMGGILGGISNGEEVRIRVAVKPTPTISIEQETGDMETLENTTVKFTTRNDPSIIPRIYAVCEAMVRIAVLDCMYMTESLKAFCNL
jgi:chorismate synthase